MHIFHKLKLKYNMRYFNKDPELTIRDIETLSQSDYEVHHFDREPLRKGLTAMDMYDLTLTAIAFLGFGTFVMNLIMDAMAVSVYSYFAYFAILPTKQNPNNINYMIGTAEYNNVIIL